MKFNGRERVFYVNGLHLFYWNIPKKPINHHFVSRKYIKINVTL